MGVFALGAAEELFRAVAIAAAYDLGVIAALATPRTFDELVDAIGVERGVHRVHALIAALVHAGVLVREGDRLQCGAVPERPAVVGEGWGRLAEVIREDRALPMPADPRAYHEHLVRAGSATAVALAPLLPAPSLLDLGGGAGTYTAAYLEAHAGATATLVELPAILPLARAHLASFGERVRFVEGDARTVTVAEHAVVLLANVLHLHEGQTCAALCAIAARAVAPGGAVCVLDLDATTPEGVWFALNMALYTDGGGVYSTAMIGDWLAGAGLVDIAVHHVAEVVVVVGRRP